MMKINKFLLLWSVVSPLCLLVVAGLMWKSNWRPSDSSKIGMAIVIYLVYWSLLGISQGFLLFKFKYQKLAHKWFLTTIITGFLIMMCHELTPVVLGVDTGGQGILFLIVTVPVLALLGGLVLGGAQFLILKSEYGNLPLDQNLIFIWFGASFGSWLMSFVGYALANFSNVLLAAYGIFVIFPMVALGTAVKGWAVLKFLRPLESQ